MATVIKHVQHDLRPSRVISITDESGDPLDLSTGITQVRLNMREAGSPTLKTQVPCVILSGLLQPGGVVNYAAPYDVAGKGGRVRIDWTAEAVDTAGQFEAELEAVYADGRPWTTYDTITINIREQIG